MLKVVPGARYLCEVRALVRDRLRQEEYSNDRVVNLFSDRFDPMTPLMQGIEKEQLDTAALTSVTIHLAILAGRPR